MNFVNNLISVLENSSIKSIVSNVARERKNRPKESLKIHMFTYTAPKIMDAYLKALSVLFNNIHNSKTTIIRKPLTIKKWSILSSPFIYKTAFTQFERRKHSRALICKGISEFSASKIAWFALKNKPSDIYIDIEAYKYHKISI